ncbi:MAG: phosphatase PAP2 family protein [Chryseolinea sp.]
MATYLFGLFVLVLPVGLDPLKEEGHWNFVFLIFCVTCALPGLNILIFKSFGTIKSLTLENRKERIAPFTFVTILYGAVTYIFFSRTRISINDSLLKFLLIIDILVLAATVITVFYKISIHSMAVWGFVGILLPLNKISEDGKLLVPTIVAIVLAGVIMSARLQLNAHTPREILMGSIAGLLITLGSMTFLF